VQINVVGKIIVNEMGRRGHCVESDEDLRKEWGLLYANWKVLFVWPKFALQTSGRTLVGQGLTSLNEDYLMGCTC
jgi:hypothetical protein